MSEEVKVVDGRIASNQINSKKALAKRMENAAKRKKEKELMESEAERIEYHEADTDEEEEKVPSNSDNSDSDSELPPPPKLVRQSGKRVAKVEDSGRRTASPDSDDSGMRTEPKPKARGRPKAKGISSEQKIKDLDEDNKSLKRKISKQADILADLRVTMKEMKSVVKKVAAKKTRAPKVKIYQATPQVAEGKAKVSDHVKAEIKESLLKL